jgi:hypothetical protein
MTDDGRSPSGPGGYTKWLVAAGYVLDGDVWQHPLTRRALDAGVARSLTMEQLCEWIAAGRSRNGDGR